MWKRVLSYLSYNLNMKNKKRIISAALASAAIGGGLVAATVAQSCTAEITVTGAAQVILAQNAVLRNVFSLGAAVDPTNPTVPNDANSNVNLKSIQVSRGDDNVGNEFSTTSLTASTVTSGNASESAITNGSSFRFNFTVSAVEENNTTPSNAVTNVNATFVYEYNDNLNAISSFALNDSTSTPIAGRVMSTTGTSTNVPDYLGDILNNTTSRDTLLNTIINTDLYGLTPSDDDYVSGISGGAYVYDQTYETSERLFQTNDGTNITDYYLWTFRVQTPNLSSITHLSMLVGVRSDFSAIEFPLIASS